MKRSDKAALAVGAVGTWIYIGGVDSERITERIRKRRMKKERLTVKNPDGTYRIWMERAGTFRLESQMDSVFAYGDLVNKLGRYEDQDEEKHKK